MESLLYIEIDSMCVVIVGIVLYQLLHDIDRSSETRFLVIFASLCIAFFFTDMVWFGFEGEYLPFSLPCVWAINILYFILAALMGYSWFRYSEAVQHNRRLERPIVAICSAVPALVIIIAAVLSPWTGALFSIAADGTYTRGSIYQLQPLILVVYVAYSALKALYLQNKVDSYAERRKYQTLASFVVIPLLCGVAQVLVYGVDLIYPGLAISLLWVYIDLQHQQVSLDPLTQVNNRSQIMKQFGSYVRRDSETMYLTMIDADDFKAINDKYGHLAGDKALVRIARALKRSAGGRNCFIARYGGDEFIAICNTSNPQEIEGFVADIHRNLEKLNEDDGTEFKVRVSAGFAKWGPETETMADLIAEADKALYAVKQERKAKRACL